MALDAARRIVRERGIESLTARRVADAIGYTPGTIYQHFRNMDALAEAMNAETLMALFQSCPEPRSELTVEARLMALAEAFIAFAGRHPEEWRAVIAFPYGPAHLWSDVYDAAVGDLIRLLLDATSDLYGRDAKALQEQEVRALWAGFFGLFVLDSHGRLGCGVTLAEQTRTLISFYLAKRSGP